ncbi:hypothetical protein D3093_14415 (plasmid) [Azospirillum argentinense]|uniref:Uncharacterized protein n=1 Tax=Azospirillum argentinense TaxID=2970906 RepID=A0A4D8PGJ1_9PROT|nr:hypothetical protein D3093_14415 [Azospirillum argentinense]
MGAVGSGNAFFPPLPPREREGAHAKRGKGEGVAKDQRHDPRSTLTRPLCGHPLPGRERG